MENSQLTLAGAIASGLTLLVQIITILNTNYREARNRRWAQEDIAALALQTQADKEELARTTRHSVRDSDHHLSLQFEEQKKILEDIAAKGEARLNKLLESLEAKATKLETKIDEGIGVSKEAYKEANSVNGKLRDLGVQIRDQTTKVEVVNVEPIKVVEEHNQST